MTWVGKAKRAHRKRVGIGAPMPTLLSAQTSGVATGRFKVNTLSITA